MAGSDRGKQGILEAERQRGRGRDRKSSKQLERKGDGKNALQVRMGFQGVMQDRSRETRKERSSEQERHRGLNSTFPNIR